MPKKPNHTPCRKTTHYGEERKRLLKQAYDSGKMKYENFVKYMNMPLKQWVKLRSK